MVIIPPTINHRRRLAIIGTTALVAAGAMGAAAAWADSARSESRGHHRPPAVHVEVDPEAPEVGNARCGVDLLEVEFTNDSDRELYTDVFIDAPPALRVSKSALSSYLTPGYTQRSVLEVRPGPAAEPGVHDILIDGGREPVTVPVTVTDLSDAPNVALRAEPSASSTFDNYPVCGAIDGDRDQDHWNQYTGWQDLTTEEFPDWFQLTFDEPERVGVVEVLTRPGDDAMRDWNVQVRADGQWVTVDEVRGNENEGRRSSFDPVETDALRLLILDSNDGDHSRIVELEVYASLP